MHALENFDGLLRRFGMNDPLSDSDQVVQKRGRFN